MSAVQYSTVVPAGQHAPFAVVSDTDHSAWVIITSALGISFTLITLITRVLIRRFVIIGWASDDTVLVLATVFSLVQASLLLVTCAKGMGRTVDTIPVHQLINLGKVYYVSNIFYICAFYLSKMSAVLFIRRVSAVGTKVYTYCTVLLAVLPLIMVAFIFAVALQCELARPWIIIGVKCPGYYVRWQVQGATSAFLEFAIFAAPVSLVWKLHKPLSTKLEVVLPFALRLPLIVFTSLRIESFDKSKLSTDPTFAGARYICWTQAEVTYAVTSATIPIARKFVLDLITFYNCGPYRDHAPAKKARIGTAAYKMSTLTSKIRRHDHSMLQSKSSAAATAAAADDAAAHDAVDIPPDDTGSQEMIIRKNVTVDIEPGEGKAGLDMSAANIIPSNWKAGT